MESSHQTKGVYHKFCRTKPQCDIQASHEEAYIIDNNIHQCKLSCTLVNTQSRESRSLALIKAMDWGRAGLHNYTGCVAFQMGPAGPAQYIWHLCTHRTSSLPRLHLQMALSHKKHDEPAEKTPPLVLTHDEMSRCIKDDEAYYKLLYTETQTSWHGALCPASFIF